MRSFAAAASFAATFASLCAATILSPQDLPYNHTVKHFDCGVSHSHASHHFNKTVQALHKNGRMGPHSLSHKAKIHNRQSSGINVDTVFHIITSTSSAGTITQDMANAQIAQMNTMYGPYGITFNLIGTTFTANDAWAVASGDDMNALKTSLRQGTYATLNLYFHTDLAGGILGTCTLPSDIGPGTPDPSSYVSDGCNVQANTMPGGNVLGYNSGMTAVHETGHWLGLLHVFEGYTCDGDGDLIADTPMQSMSTAGCPAAGTQDSCPDSPGFDAVNNIMDYSTDACYTGFTGLQLQRMHDLFGQYRSGR